MIATPLVGLALVLAGCGGDDEEKTTSTAASTPSTTAVATITKADYVTKADTICKTADDATDQAIAAALKALGTEQPTAEQQTTIATDIVVPSIEQQLTALRALPKPAEGADDVDAMLTELESAIASVNEDPTTLFKSDDSPSPFAAANEKAKAVGLTECGAE